VVACVMVRRVRMVLFALAACFAAGTARASAQAQTPFVPTQIAGLAAWYDASDPATLASAGGAVSAWADKSGNGNTLSQPVAAAMPAAGTTIGGLGALDFSGAQYLSGSNPAFSANVFNASTLFVVTSAPPATAAGSVLSAGTYPGKSSPRFELRLYEGAQTHFDFNNTTTGRLAATVPYTGPALWTAGGGSGNEFLRKDGSALASSSGPGTTVSGSFPLVVGGNLGGFPLSYPFTGEIGEILIFNRELADADMLTVEGYLACKWGLQNQLPAGHPYATVCPGAAPSPSPSPSAAPSAVPALISESFTGTATTPNLWFVRNGACLTAGGGATPATSIPPCGAAAPVDPPGSGALQLTGPVSYKVAQAISEVALDTARGFQIVFTDAAFGTHTTGGNGLAVFLADARDAFPASESLYLSNELGYLQMGQGYAGIGFDEAGGFGSVAISPGGNSTGAGGAPETVAIRGAFTAGNPFLGGYTGANGQLQSLPFPLDAPASASRPANPPTMRITLTPASVLTVEIDPHDGNGYRTAFSGALAGVNGQPPLPPQVYLGFTAATGNDNETHQIYGLTVTPLAPAAQTFTPAQIPNLAAWFDASDATTLAQTGTSVGSWLDKSGNGNTLVQPAGAAMPQSGTTIAGLNSLTFAGAQYLTGSNPSFSNQVFGASTLFAVTSAVAQSAGTLLSTGTYPGKTAPRWELRPFENGQTHFDFDTTTTGRLAGSAVAAGPALWTAAGSPSGEYLRKDGNALSASSGPGVAVSGAFPLVVGGNRGGFPLSYPYQGSVGEIVIYNRYLSTAESQSVEGYLACKWGLQNRLPENHPYRSVCPGAVGAAPLPTPSPPPLSSAIPVIPEVRSTNGQLSLAVTAQPDAFGNPKLTYNGSPVPPTLRVLPGDILSVTLTNELPAPPANAGYANDTNLHFHGLHVSPNAPGDDSIDMLALPGQTLFYQLAIPYDHPTGLYWYHSHAHGEAERQTLSGMSGALIVDGIAAGVPALANMPERVLVVRDAPLAGQALPAADRKQLYAMGWALAHADSRAARLGQGTRATMTMGASTAVRASDSRRSRNPYVTVDPGFRHRSRHPFASGDGHCAGPETALKTWTVNGVAQPSIGIRPGEQQFWRLVNAGADTYLDVAVDNTQLQIVAIDGVPLGAGVGTPQTLTVNDYVVPPASRVEFVVTGPPAGTTAYLRTLCFDAGSAGPAMPAAILATLDPTTSPTDQLKHRQRVSPKAVAYHFPRRGARRAPAVRGLRPAFTTVPVTRTQTLTYSDQNTINGQAYDPAAPPQFYAQSGTVEQWTIVNNSNQVHTFHIHQIHFLVQAINGVTQPAQYVMDNVNVPAASAAGPGSVTLLMDFTDPRIIGTFLLHCHILAHEDAGMMAKIVVGTAPPLAAVPALTFAGPSSPAQSVNLTGGQPPYSIAGCGPVASGSVSGSTVTVTPAGTGSCVFTISDAFDIPTGLAVTVGSAGFTGIVTTPSSLGFLSPSAAAQNASVSGGTPPYFVSGCAGVALAGINGTQNGVTVSPAGTGACALTISDSASDSATLSVSVNAPSTGGPADNITFHHDSARTGWYSGETTLTTANVASAQFGLLGTLTAPQGMPAFGKVVAQPLYVQNEMTIGGTAHNLVIVATTTDQVYAFDEFTNAVVWEANFTNPAAGITPQLTTDSGCSSTSPYVGIVGTPVIDRALDRLYAVVATKENGVFHLRLHALALGSGADAVSPVEVTASVPLSTGGIATVLAQHNFNRGALLEANGNIYVPLGTHCDFQATTTHGWLLAFSATSLAPAGNAFDTTGAAGSYFLGSLWNAGFGPAADAAGNVYFSTGNGPYDGYSNFAMSALRLPGNLDIRKAGTFTPYGAAGDAAADADLASGGVVLLPPLAGSALNLMVLGGKCGAGSANGGTNGCQKYLLNRNNLGGFSPGDAGALWHANTAGGMWGGPAVFQDQSGATYVVYGGQPLNTYKLSLAPLGLSVLSSANVGCLTCTADGSQPVVSSNGTTPGTAIVWAMQTPGSSGGPITLYAFDALNMSHTLFRGTAGSWTVPPGFTYIGGALNSPTVADGRVYVPVDGAVAVFGLAP